MKAIDVMTSPVISVTPETPVREIAALLFERRISGLPVVEQGRLVGMVSEADLLHRHEIGTDCVASGGSWWPWLFGQDRSIEQYIKSHAAQARDIMSREVISVSEDTPIADIADVLESRGFKRVPVVRGGTLVGIVSRADLVQALAKAAEPAAPGNDVAIRRRLLGELNCQSWWRESSSNVVVDDGVVHYWGLIYSDDEREAARVAAESLAGVRGVEDHRWAYQDLPQWV